MGSGRGAAPFCLPCSSRRSTAAGRSAYNAELRLCGFLLRNGKACRVSGNPFDRALEALQHSRTAEAYALQHGEPGTSEYRAAWLRFRQEVRTSDDHGTRRPGSGSGKVDVVGVLNTTIERMILLDGAAMANAQLLDSQSGGLRIAAHSGFTPAFLDFFDTVDDTTSACGSALATGRPVWVTDTAASKIFAGTRALEVMLEADSRAVASVPITSPNGRLIGMVSTHHKRPTTWTPTRKLELVRVAQATGRVLDHISRTRCDS